MKSLFLLLTIATVSLAYGQTKIGGSVMPNVMKVGDEYLKMNGGGIRTKMFMNLYIGVLYLQEKSSDATTIINADKPMAVKIKIISGMVDNENFEEAIREGFNKSTKNNIAPIKDRMEKMIKEGFAEDIQTSDVYDLVYQPATGCTLIKNNKSVVTVKGLDFKKALFGIWLGTQPAQEDLKLRMLGK
jgi:hypothetical protein